MAAEKEGFLLEVKKHIKSKEAKVFIHKELEHHLQETKTELMSEGIEETEAEEKAVLQMGSPAELGMQLNKIHKPRVDWMLIGLLAAAFGMGILPLLSVQDGNSSDFVAHQIVYIGLGLLAALAFMFFDYRKLQKWSWHLLTIGVLYLVLLLIAPFSIRTIINGVPYFIIPGIGAFGGMSILPLFYLFWASFFSREKPNLWIGWLIFAITLFLFLSLPGFPIAMMYGFLVMILFFRSAVTRKTIIATTSSVGGIIVLLGILAWFTSNEYQKVRLFAFLNPSEYSETSGFMYIKIREMLAEGGWLGNPEKTASIPNLHSDYAFVNITYFYGWLMAGLLIIILALLLARMVSVGGQIKDPYGKQLVTGAIALYSVQFLYNIGMTLGVLPIISISLPLISYGLTPAILNAFVIGIALSVYRRKDFTAAVHR
ncbi:FtsW/RodA/SpoVE family cell cycle protein [Bacillus infantis]|uniref:FtsW/RodA/SpoVE family cell cycle protein n=1 Tax=Bacillus infantis TaxID=324767 RepID=UPI002155919E|nr:FtsW/RodA/SpoVE family cell cycle protein [Bacillus infantis]MCR6611233.1 FtsW/RodA/SpoVE family cell cycle protein [Bacillus infantis]